MYFEAVARHTRVNLAADELMVSPSAVSQQIKSLEEQMGVLLFRRVKRRLVLTEEGERLFHSATSALGMLRTAQARVARTREHRNLVIRVAPSFGVRWLGRLVADFIEHNPGIDLHVDATSELTDFEKEHVDLEIRYGLHPPPGLHSQSLITDHVLPLCAPRQAKQVGELGIEGVLGSTRLIHTVKAEIRWRDWLDDNGFHDIDDTAHNLRFDRSSMSLQAAQDEVGIALESATLAMSELTTGALLPLAHELGCLTFPTYWLSCPQRNLNRRAVKAFLNWIEGQASAHQAARARLLLTLGVASSRPYSS